ncbi:MAG: flagellar export protein FliJ [Ignavibacterium sp.]|nr:flagellar export protein FliJ [Ignavibacterium sp.]
MLKFKFKLEPVKKAKENLSKTIKKDIAKIDSMINEKNDERDRLINELDSLRNYRLNRVSSSEMQFIEGYKIALSSKIKDVEKEILELEKHKENKIKQLQVYNKELKIIERFEEIKRNEFEKEQNKIENKTFDEIAIQNYAREKL